MPTLVEEVALRLRLTGANVVGRLAGCRDLRLHRRDFTVSPIPLYRRGRDEKGPIARCEGS